MEAFIVVLPLLALVAVQDMLTGIFAAPGIVATMIASRAMEPRRAIYLSTLAQLIGPLLFGVAVASTIGSEVVDPAGITPAVLEAALAATVFWMLFSWHFRIPSSSTHALVGGLVGAVLAALGPDAIRSAGLLKVLVSLSLTVPLGVIGGFVATNLCYWLARNAKPQVNQRFNAGQLLLSLMLGFVIGSANAQNIMGITTLGLVAAGLLPRFEVPLWVMVGSAACLAAGNLIGGMRIMHSVGMKYFRIRPIHGFSAELSSTAIILMSALLGGSVSTTHVTSMSIIGAGAAERVSMVRWGFVRRVLLTWVLTIPGTMACAALFYRLLHLLNSG